MLATAAGTIAAAVAATLPSLGGGDAEIDLLAGYDALLPALKGSSLWVAQD